MEKNYITYKGFKIEVCPAGYSAWGASLFDPIDTVFIRSASLAACKKYLDAWLKNTKVKKWHTIFDARITKW